MIRKLIDIGSILVAGTVTVVWMFKGYDSLFKAIVILLLWMIFTKVQKPNH